MGFYLTFTSKHSTTQSPKIFVWTGTTWSANTPPKVWKTLRGAQNFRERLLSEGFIVSLSDVEVTTVN